MGGRVVAVDPSERNTIDKWAVFIQAPVMTKQTQSTRSAAIQWKVFRNNRNTNRRMKMTSKSSLGEAALCSVKVGEVAQPART